MSGVRRISGDGLERLLERLARETELIGPVEVEGEVMFLPVTDPRALTRDYVNSLVPPKELLLPTPERLLGYRVRDGVPELGPDAPPPGERVIFGIRSCDVAGLAYLERYLSGAMFGRPDLADAPFMGRRAATTLISVVCATPGPTCMCVCCQGGPRLERGYDWQLSAIADGWLVEIDGERGERLAERHADLLAPATDRQRDEARERVRHTIEHFGEHSMHRVPTMAATRMMSAGKVEASFWRIVGDRCFECGGCAYVCPTCWCFNVVDLGPAGSGGFEPASDGTRPMVPAGVTDAVGDGDWERVRMRDCCQLAGFVRQAGGGYPRVSCGERCVTRFFHKLSQQFHERMDAPGCTGCGRCVQVCLGEEGIDRVAEAMREVMIGQREASARLPRTAPALGMPVPLGER